MIDPRWYQLINVSIWLNAVGSPLYALRLYDTLPYGRIYYLRSKFGGKVKLVLQHCQHISVDYVDSWVDEIVTTGRIEITRHEGLVKFNDSRLWAVTLFGDRTRPVGKFHVVDDSCFPMSFVNESDWIVAYNVDDLTQE